MKIALFYNRSPGTVGGYFHKCLQDLGHTVDHFQTGQAKGCPKKYDAYLRVDHGDYQDDLPENLHPRIFYAVDTHLNRSFQSIRRLVRRYDLTICVQQRAAQILPNALWVPLGCDPEIHGRKPGRAEHDLAFVGNDGGVPRKFYLQELREQFPNSFIGRAPYDRMADIYSRSKIGFHYIECTSPLKDHVSMRVYEALASGTLLLANALAEGAFESLGLRDRKELVVYRSPVELFELIRYFLNHEEERRQIAAAGQASVLKHHTYRQRAQQIVKAIEERCAGQTP